VIHGDYRRWARPGPLDSTTNYEVYKGLFSSHNDRNYFEIAYALNRQFGPSGIYRDLPLYAFADNHDVPRIASSLAQPAHLYPLHALLFTMPGVPALYAGSEWGIAGTKQGADDWALRPALAWPGVVDSAPHPALAAAIARFAAIRHACVALRRGSYEQLFVGPELLVFARRAEGTSVVVAVNAAAAPASQSVAAGVADGTVFVDQLDPEYSVRVERGRLEIAAVPPCWARILVPR
jgi:glycosidase